MKLLLISLCTSGVMREQFIYYANEFAKRNKLFCVTNDNVSLDELNACEVLNVRYKRHEPFSYFSVSNYRKIISFIDNINPDVVFVFTPHPVNILLANYLKKYRVLYLSHDPIPHMGMSKLDCIVRKIQNWQYYSISNRVVVAGQELVRQVMETSSLSREKIVSIPFPIFGGYINDSVEAIKEKVDLLFFGRIEAYKGLDILIESLDYLEEKPEIYIAGSGNIKDAFPNVKSIPSNIHIIGYVPDDLLISYIKRSKATVFPYYDATGTSVVCQSYYYGTPVIASSVGVFPEYVDDGGLIFEAGNAKELALCIDKVISNDVYRAELSSKAKKICSDNFMMEQAGYRYQELFEVVSKE